MLTILQEPKKGGFEISLATDSDRIVVTFLPLEGRLKTRENIKLLALKVIAVAYERCPITRGSKYSDLTEKHLVCCKTGL